MNILIGNYGNETIALIAWAYSQNLDAVKVVNVDTGWMACSWQERVTAGIEYARACGFEPLTLRATPDFSTLMQQRQAFPEPTQAWCASMLKGLTLLDWLDQCDPQAKACILLGKTRFGSRVNQYLSEYVTDSDHYDGRLIRHPLVHQTKDEFNALVEQAGFALLAHRSLECEPCIHSTPYDFSHLKAKEIARMVQLETALGKTMFSAPITQMVEKYQGMVFDNADYLDKFYRGCASPFGCGL